MNNTNTSCMPNFAMSVNIQIHLVLVKQHFSSPFCAGLFILAFLWGGWGVGISHYVIVICLIHVDILIPKPHFPRTMPISSSEVDI